MNLPGILPTEGPFLGFFPLISQAYHCPKQSHL